MLKLKPSAKTSNRYLLISGSKESIEKAILDYIGILGYAKANPRIVKKSGKNNVLAVDRGELDKVRGAFAIASDKIQVIKVSGTLKGLGVRGK
jgi:RNase P/RNase MRP subunit POP5